VVFWASRVCCRLGGASPSAHVWWGASIYLMAAAGASFLGKPPESGIRYFSFSPCLGLCSTEPRPRSTRDRGGMLSLRHSGYAVYAESLPDTRCLGN
jgi:hypothetical protein